MGTKNNPGAFDCYANAEPDEPMFVLLGRDKHAPTLVWLWAVLRELDGEEPEKVKEARGCCIHMMEWANNHDRKFAGLGQATLAGVLELIRSFNTAARLSTKEEFTNSATAVDIMRQFLAESAFEKDEKK